MSTPDRDPHADERAWEEIVERLRGPAHGPLGENGLEELEEDGPRDYELAEDPDEDWQPPDPGDVTLGLSSGTMTAWGVLVLVPVVMVVLAFMMNGLPWWLWVPGLAVVISSIASLLRKLPEDRDDGDDGAVV
ncbi:hypothetical protein FCK90_06325 [Kocuria coralli]|uniref:Uncharacterized protein n=1 Tax=Kocuria coralli TaxID=1461025 RepID=A0A5J5KYD1_9MICC|nr:hypothetical protein [Kocuria coralli]KAA9394438.1 hypothetical protein FCK90_06325 [Kocuria coralli]